MLHISAHSLRQYCLLLNPSLNTTGALRTDRGPSPGAPPPPRVQVTTHLPALLDLCVGPLDEGPEARRLLAPVTAAQALGDVLDVELALGESDGGGGGGQCRGGGERDTAARHARVGSRRASTWPDGVVLSSRLADAETETAATRGILLARRAMRRARERLTTCGCVATARMVMWCRPTTTGGWTQLRWSSERTAA